MVKDAKCHTCHDKKTSPPPRHLCHILPQISAAAASLDISSSLALRDLPSYKPAIITSQISAIVKLGSYHFDPFGQINWVIAECALGILIRWVRYIIRSKTDPLPASARPQGEKQVTENGQTEELEHLDPISIISFHLLS